MNVCERKGTYEGEMRNGVPHGKGTKRLSEYEYFEGYWKDGVPHGPCHQHLHCRHDWDGFESLTVRHTCGVWNEGVLSGTVWRYEFEDDFNEMITEECVFLDTDESVIFGINRRKTLIGKMAEKLGNAGTVIRDEYGIWGNTEIGGHTFMGQFYEMDEGGFVPHGFCIETDGDAVLYCGSFDMGERKGAGVTWKDESGTEPVMDYAVTE